jgi:ribose 1,5-bisphosphokinase PhnN
MSSVAAAEARVVDLVASLRAADILVVVIEQLRATLPRIATTRDLACGVDLILQAPMLRGRTLSRGREPSGRLAARSRCL